MNKEEIAVYVIGALIFITFETFMYLFSEAREQNLEISRKKRIKKHLKEKGLSNADVSEIMEEINS
jgi:hypothetical protein